MVQLNILARCFAHICLYFPFNTMCLLFHSRSKLVNGHKKSSIFTVHWWKQWSRSHQNKPFASLNLDPTKGSITLQLLDMCTCKESTSEALFEIINEILSQFGLSWKNCIAVSLANTSVNLGRKNSIITRVLNISRVI